MKAEESLFDMVSGNKTNDKGKRLSCIIGPHEAKELVSVVTVKWDCVENEVRVLIKHT